MLIVETLPIVSSYTILRFVERMGISISDNDSFSAIIEYIRTVYIGYSDIGYSDILDIVIIFYFWRCPR